MPDRLEPPAPAAPARHLPLLAAMSALVAVSVALGAVFHHWQQQELRRRARRELAAVARLREGEIERWRGERAGDAAALAAVLAPSLVTSGAGQVVTPSAAVASLITTIRRHHGYVAAKVVTPAFEVLACDGQCTRSVPEDERVAVAEALAGREAIFGPLVLDAERGDAGLAVAHAVRDAAGRPVAAVLLRISAVRQLYPLLTAWAGASRGEETVLAVRDGDVVTLASPLRQGRRPAFSVHQGVERQLVGSLAFRGEIDDIEAPDYAGVPSVAVARPVPGVPWIVIAKMPRSTAYADLPPRERAATAGLLLTVLFGWTALAFQLRRRQLLQYRRLYDAERQAHGLARRLEEALRQANDAILITDGDGSIVDCNRGACQLYGYEQKDLLGRSVGALFGEQAGPPPAGQAAPVNAFHRLRTGGLVAVEVNTATFSVDGKHYRHYNVRDVSMRLAREQRLRRLTRAHKLWGRVGELVVRERDRGALCEAVCRVAVEDGGYAFAWIGEAVDGGMELRAFSGLAAEHGDLLRQAVRATTPDQGITGIVLQSGTAAVCADVATDERARPWRDALMAYGCRSFASLPLPFGGAGSRRLAFSLHSSQPMSFDEEEMEILGRIAGTVGGALRAMDLEAERAVIAERLRDSEARFRFAIETAPVPMAVRADDGHFEALSEGWVRFSGYPRQALPTVEEWTLLAYGTRGSERLAAIRRDQGDATTRHQGIYAVTASDGQTRQWDFWTTGLPADSEGRSLKLVVANDVTALMQAERSLEESKRRLDGLIASALDPILFVDPDGRVEIFNLAAERVFRLPAPAILGKPLSTLLPIGREADLAAFLREAASTGRSSELVFTRAGGEEFLAEASVSQVIGEEGTHHTLIVRDVTDRRRAEQQNRMLSRIIEQSTNVVIITDVTGHIEYVNPRFTAVTGYTLDEVLGRNPRLLQSGETSPELYREMWASVLDGHRWHGQWNNRRKDGTEYLADVTIAPVRDERGQTVHLIATQEDRSEQKRLEAQFQQAQKLESLGLLAGGVAHDFNNLLTSVIGYAGFIGEELPPDHEAQDDLRELRKGLDRATALTRQLLTFARRQVIDPTIVDLNQVVDNLGKLLGRLIPAHIRLVVQPSAEPLLVRADAGQLEQVLVNLCVNARDAMPDGGEILLELGRQGELAGEPGARACLSVRDTGVGMTDEVKQHLFEPFFTTKPKGQGTGLGLATCFGIVRQAGGEIGVESALGAGTTFRVLLPLVPPGEGSVPDRGVLPVTSTTAVEHGNGETILVAEDDPALRGLLERALASDGYRVLTAADGREALDVLQACGAAGVHLVLTDVVMPRMGGRELLEAARALRPDLPVMFMSGYADDPLLLKAIGQPGTRFVAKPFAPDVLSRRIREFLDSPRAD